MLKAQQKLIRYTLINPKIRHTRDQFKGDPHLNFYPVVGFKQTKLGALTLNKPNNQNLLSSETLDQLYRFLLSYNDDQTMENIWLQHRGKMFSGGIDFKELKQNQLYLDKLYHFCVLLGKINKPIFAKVSGGARNIAGYVLSMLSSPIGTKMASMRLDECQKGFVPIFGGSHRLNRIPFQLGLYFALTGEYMDVDRMGRLGFINGMTDLQIPNKQYRRHLSEINLFFRDRIPYYAYDEQLNEVQLQAAFIDKNNKIKWGMKLEQGVLLNDRRNFHTRFAMNQYKLALIDYANAIQPDNSFSDRKYSINNYFQMRMQRPLHYLQEKGLYTSCNLEGAGDIPIEKIIPIFSLPSLKQIVQALKEDGSDWAVKTLSRIYWKDSLASLLTFQLIRSASDLSWAECLKQQYTVARRLLQISQLKIQNHQLGTRFVLKNPFSSTKIENIPQSQIRKFFRPAQKESEQLQHSVPNDAMLPNVDYLAIPDAPRTYLNRQFFQDKNAHNSPQQIKRFLNQHKIDYRNPNFNVDILRNYIHRDFELRNQIQYEENRINFTIQNQQLKQRYKTQRIDVINKKFQDKNAMKQRVNRIVANIFQDKFENRFKQLEKTAHLAGKQQKMKIFKVLKKHLIETIIKKGDQIELKRMLSNPNFLGPLQFAQDGKGIYEFERSSIKNDPIISKASQIESKRKQGSFSTLRYAFKDSQLDSQAKVHLGRNDQVKQEETKKNQMLQKIQQRYGQDAKLQDKARYYRELMVQTSITSEEAASLLQWSDQDFQNTLAGYPEEHRTYRGVVQKIEKQINAKNSEKIKGLRSLQKQRSIFLKQFNHINNSGPGLEQKKRLDYPFLYEKDLIPNAFRRRFEPLLDEVLAYFSEKYESSNKNGLKSIKNYELGVLDEWANWSISMDYTDFLKSDVEYIFSYLAILELRQIMIRIRQMGGLQKQENRVKEYMAKAFGLEFDSNISKIVDKQFIRFLYSMLDLHTRAKGTIIMPQTKLLDFLNRLKIGNQIRFSKYSNLSFESLMLLIARDRRRILNRKDREVPHLGIQPQHTMSLLRDIKLDNKLDLLKFDQDKFQTDTLFVAHLHTASEMGEKKRLLQNFFVYMRELQKVLAKAAGTDNFVNQELRNPIQKQQYLNKLKKTVSFRQKSDEWFDRTLKTYIETLFEMRYQVQKDISKGDLRMFDKGFARLLESENLLQIMLQIVQQQVKLAQREYGSKRVFQKQTSEAKDQQQKYLNIMRRVKNPDALRRLNNLMLTDQIRKQHIEELQKKSKNKNRFDIDDILFERTKEEVEEQKNAKLCSFSLSQLSLNRMVKDIFKYPKTPHSNLHYQEVLPDGGSQFKRKYVNFSKQKETELQSKVSFLSEIKEIKNFINGESLAEELQKTIDKVQKAIKRQASLN